MRDNYHPKIFTWHIHGTYLYYLSQIEADIYIPVRKQKDEGYYGRGQTFPFGPNVIEVPVDELPGFEFDLILFQTNRNFLHDQFDILTESQRRAPRIYIEHDPPREHPVETRHKMTDPEVLLVHVTAFNALMWDNGQVPVKIIDHGVLVKQIPYRGTLERGVVMVNNFADRGRLLGLDIFEQVRREIPLDLIGMNSERLGGLGEVLHPELPEFLSNYRFFFNPIRYTSLGLSVCEAMTLGLPVVGLATTEMATVMRDGENGFACTSIHRLIDNMQALLSDPELARRLGAEGQKMALNRFSIERFKKDWEQTIELQIKGHKAEKSFLTAAN